MPRPPPSPAPASAPGNPDLAAAVRLGPSSIGHSAIGLAMLAFVEGVDPGLLWAIGGLVGLILEMLVPAFVIGSFGVSALFAGLAAWLGASPAWQFVTFGALGFAFVVPARRFLHRSGPRRERGADALPGKVGHCLEPIDGDLMAGVVDLDGTRWTAITVRGDQIPRGAAVEVVAVEGARLLVTQQRTPPPERPRVT